MSNLATMAGLMCDADASATAPTPRSVSHLINSNVKTFPGPKPTGVAVGDDLRACLVTGITAGATISPPSGWPSAYYDVTIASTMRILRFRRVITSGDVALSNFTFTASTYVNGCTMMLAAFVGANASQTTPSSGTTQATMQDDPISVTVPSVSAPSANNLGLVWECFANNATNFNTTVSFDNGFTQLDIVGNSTASSPVTRGLVIALATKTLTASGATGDVHSTVGHGGQSYRRSIYGVNQVTIAPV